MQDKELSKMTVEEALEQAAEETPMFVNFVQGRLRQLVLSIRPGDASNDSTAAIAREMQYLAGAMRNMVEILVLFNSEGGPEPFEGDGPS